MAPYKSSYRSLSFGLIRHVDRSSCEQPALQRTGQASNTGGFISQKPRKVMDFGPRGLKSWVLGSVQDGRSASGSLAWSASGSHFKVEDAYLDARPIGLILRGFGPSFHILLGPRYFGKVGSQRDHLLTPSSAFVAEPAILAAHVRSCLQAVVWGFLREVSCYSCDGAGLHKCPKFTKFLH